MPNISCLHIDSSNDDIVKLVTMMVKGNEMIIYEYENVFQLYLIFT
jgi:hypothetical protein